jgi:hypothetical protein
VIASADAKPTASLRELVDHYFAQIDAQLARLDGVLADDVAQLNALIGRAALPPIAV